MSALGRTASRPELRPKVPFLVNPLTVLVRSAPARGVNDFTTEPAGITQCFEY
jgi:hypothetical protein